MSVKQECPMCAEWMQIAPTEQVDRVAGSSQTTTRHVLEWRCPECDYFEEVEGDIDGLAPELQKWRDEK